jgi:hypothetical protein
MADDGLHVAIVLISAGWADRTSAMTQRDAALRLLCRCAAPSPDRSGLRVAAAEVRDWASFVDLAVAHGMAALAQAALDVDGVDLTPDAVRRLRAQRRNLARRGLAAAAETARLVRLLDAVEVRALPLKGPALAVLAYGDTGARDYGDLDLLVATPDLPRARAALQRDGYAPLETWTPREERWHARSRGQLVELTRPAGALLLDVHGSVHEPSFSLRLERDLWRGATAVHLDGVLVPAMSPEGTLLVACTHAGRSRWRRLEWVAAVAALANRPDLDWPLVCRLARRAGAARMIDVAIRLARDLTGHPLPRATPPVAQDPAVAPLAREFARELLAGDPVRPAQEAFDTKLREVRLDLRLRERRRDRALYLARFLVGPTLVEAQMVKLPRALEPLYPLVRSGRLAVSAAQRLRGAA